jgi:hypothetical protein
MIFRFSLFVIIVFSFFACKKEENNKVHKSGLKYKINYVSSDSLGGLFVDKIRDSEISFADLDTMSINITDDNIKVDIGLLRIPNELVFNPNASQSGIINYIWTVCFDIDSSASETHGDLQFIIANSKFGDQFVSKDILGSSSADILMRTYYENFVGYDSTIFSIKDFVTQKGNKFHFSVPKNANSILGSINSRTKVYFMAYYCDGLLSYFDYYPD